MSGAAARWVALLGGTFDPVHEGHLRVAQAALAHPRVDAVRLIPSPAPPHKPGATFAPYADRVAMCRLACASLVAIEVWELEAERSGPTFTIDTMNTARRLLAPQVPAFLMGADSLLDLPAWHRLEALLRDHVLLVVPRPGFDLSLVDPAILARVHVLPMIESPISSTEARAAAARGGNVPLTADVERYIRAKGLYGT